MANNLSEKVQSKACECLYGAELNITEGTVKKWTCLEHQNGKVLIQNFVLQLVIEQPGIYLHEIRQELQNGGTDASIATICRFLQRCGFTRTK